MKTTKLFASLVLIYCSCEDPLSFFAERVYRVRMVDQSGIGFSYIVGYNYPDTLIPGDNNRLRGVEQGGYGYLDSKKKWKEVYDGLPADTLSIFFFSGDTLIKYPWEKIRVDYNILDRYDLSLQDLENNNWEVVFPR